MNPSQPAPPERLRPVTWPVWLAWVLVTALGPVFSTIAATAVEKQVSPNAQPRALIIIGLLALTAFAILAPAIMQGLVLKRIVPKLSVWFWLFCIALSGIAWFVLMLGRGGHGDTGLIEAGYRTQFQLQGAAMTQRLDGALNASHILNLPWGPFLLWTIATSALTALIPAWALGSASGRQRAALLFFTAAIAAACASGIVEQITNMTVDHPLNTWALNGQSWTQRFQALAVRAGAGAVWGAVIAIVVALMTRRPEAASVPNTSRFAIHRPAGQALLLLAPLLIALLAPFAGYLAGPRGLVAGAPELRKALALAPSQDRSQGETVLAYSHDVAFPVARMAATIAPDGQSAIVRAADHTLVQVDLATGRRMRQLAGALAPSERHALAWSPDGRTLALRSNGAEVPIPNTNYTRHQSRVRLYTLPDLTPAGEFSNNEGECFDGSAREPMLFSPDSKSLWLACGQYYTVPKPDDPMAIRLDVPAMQVLDVRRYGEGAESGQTRGLERIGDSVWAWQFPGGGKAFRVYDLTHARDIVTVPMPTALIGKLTEQTGRTELDEQTIRLSFCGEPPGAPAGAGPESWICRKLSFDTGTGAPIGSADKDDFRIPNPPASLPHAILSGHGLRIESFWRDDSKTGELLVRDSATGRERQRIVSIAQRPLQMSGDWLMTLSVNGGGLRLYRIQP
jgi:hypothetical protein